MCFHQWLPRSQPDPLWHNQAPFNARSQQPDSHLGDDHKVFRICCDIPEILSGPPKPAHFFGIVSSWFCLLSFGFVFIFSFGFCGLGRTLSLNLGRHRRDLSKWSGQNGLSELEQMVGTWANDRNKWSRLAHMDRPLTVEGILGSWTYSGLELCLFGFEKCCPNGVFQAENGVEGDPADEGQNYRFT